MYLNEVYYGASAYGVQAASKVYFGKSVHKLSLSEAALLAGLPQRPGELDPTKNLKAALARRNTVLAKMAELGFITPKQLKAAKRQKPRLVHYKAPTRDDWKAPYFVDYVLTQLVQRYGAETVYRGGLKVHTTLNYKMQQAAEEALRKGVARARGLGVTEGALVCVEPRSGFIRAMVGGVSYKRHQYNNAVQGKRQPGSAFKPIVYAAAIDSRPDRYGPYASIDNSRIRYRSGGRWWTPNGGGPHGLVSMRTALTYSYNNAAVNTAKRIGVRRVLDYARRMGIRSPMAPTLAMALGAYEVSPLEMASAFAIFANGGDRAEPMAIRYVLDHEGDLLENNRPEVERSVIRNNTVAEMSGCCKTWSWPARPRARPASTRCPTPTARPAPPTTTRMPGSSAIRRNFPPPCGLPRPGSGPPRTATFASRMPRCPTARRAAR
jgi:membrane peptidoglycan carboxypeptidase